MQAFNIEKGLIQVKETLYNSLVYTVLLDNPTEAFFDKTVGVIKGVPCAGTIQHFFGDLHARNPSQLSHLHFHQWEAYMQSTFCRWHYQYNGSHQRLTTKSYQQTAEYSMETSTDKSMAMGK